MNVQFDFADHHVVVFGGTTGINPGIAQAYAAAARWCTVDPARCWATQGPGGHGRRAEVRLDHTGDQGMWDEGGQMRFLDRKKDMIKTGGENVASVRVEAVLLLPPAWAGAAVLGVPHPHWGEAVRAIVTSKPGADCDEAQLIEHRKGRLGDFEVPKAVRFVQALPVSATGKVQKHVLRKEYSQSMKAQSEG